MKLTKTTFAATAFAAGVFLAVAAPLSASAHIEVEPDSTAAGSSTVLTFSLPHGCAGSATTTIGIDIPESIQSVTPTVNPGWDVSKVAVDLAKPIDDGEGNSVTTRTGQVVYTAQTPLADGLRTTFALSLQLPEDAAGKTLEFPVHQTCEVGETTWDEKTVAGEEEPEHPAPSVTVTAATADEHGHDAGGAAGDAAGDAPSDDVLARVLGVGGLAVGAIGIVLAVTARRKQTD